MVKKAKTVQVVVIMSHSLILAIFFNFKRLIENMFKCQLKLCP